MKSILETKNSGISTNNLTKHFQAITLLIAFHPKEGTRFYLVIFDPVYET